MEFTSWEVHSILKILRIQVGLIIIHTFLTMWKLILRSTESLMSLWSRTGT
jgi:hypothetical protein